MQAQRVPIVTINGDTPNEARLAAQEALKRGTARGLLATQKCAKRGLNASTADVAIYYSQEWSNDDRQQSEDRIGDVQKKKPLLYIDMTTRGMIDEDVSKRVLEKGITANAILLDYFGRKNIKR